VKLHIPVVHIEAGLRSFNKRMPEEVNRITADHASTLLFSPTRAGVENLRKEGIPTLEDAKAKGAADLDNPYVFHCGDLMYDNTLHYGAAAESKADVFERSGIDRSNFLLATIHRPQNTDNLEILIGILSALNAISVDNGVEIVLPLHPRTANILAKSSDACLKEIRENERFKLIDPVGFMEMILFEKSAKMVLTDSGGVQKEAFFMQKPCIILRPETEWTEIVDHGRGLLTGADPVRIRAAYEHFKKASGLNFPPIFGDGHAAEFICQTMVKELR
jgi:UDP-GlcNAc3NAcA epimerase